MDMKDLLPVLLGSDANVYGMARSFYMEYGVTSLAIGKGALAATANSKLVKMAVVEPNLEDDAVFVRTLTDFAKAHSGKTLVLVSCGDNYTGLMARARAALEPYYKFACPTPELVAELDTKEFFYQACERHGLSYPRTFGCTNENYKTVELPFPFPCIIKASNSVAYWNCKFPHKKKVFVAYNKEEFDAITAAIYSSSYQDNLVLQEYIPGDDNCMRVLNCYSGLDHKVKLMALGRPLLEEQTPEGIGNYAAIMNVRDDELMEKMKAFLEDVGWEGFSNFDMKYDARDGKYKLFEMNPRQGRSSFFVTASGYNLAKWLVEDVVEHKEQGLTIADAHHLWMIAPAGIIKKYLKDEALLAEAKELMRQGKVSHQLFCKEDAGLKRRIWYIKNQLNNYRKYKRYFGNKSLVD
ncbi:MAG TPA: ATP-grasp domain-containing protein [Candidatus Fournierella merdipullorum]|uniref:ATP-grasp domain-containing protein n=1 Tax=Candidatus Allofournierella merdipullorum TaxID=2838595 RepID=A0A9D2E6J9_9FIRM|nr:ATP-grasp domain-containing protein [Candidatus Fournierella merdipullorum]